MGGQFFILGQDTEPEGQASTLHFSVVGVHIVCVCVRARAYVNEWIKVDL